MPSTPPITRRAGNVDTRTSDEILEAIRKYAQRLATFTISVTGTGLAGNSGLSSVGPPPDTGTLFNDSELVLDVGAEDLDGDMEWPARLNHQHRGVRSNSVQGQTQIFGDVTFSPGTNVSLSQQGQNIQINSTGGGGSEGSGVVRVVEYFTLTPTTNKTITLQHPPFGDVNTSLNGFRRFPTRDYVQQTQSITFTDAIDFIDFDTCIAEYFWQPNPAIPPGTPFRVVEYYTLLATSPRIFHLLYHPFGDAQVHFDGLRRFPGRDYLQNDCLITFLNPIDFVDSDSVILEYWTNGDHCS